MLRVESNHDMRGFTEFEEEIIFDDDDPDFNHEVAGLTVPVIFKGERMLFNDTIALGNATVARNMSLASVHPAELHSSRSSLTTLSHSLDDITGRTWSPQIHNDHVMTIEELKLQMTSCFTCGVSWSDDHVSLDCSECGGYALERPCPECEGSCGEVWKRDLSMSHSCSKARWQGTCKQKSKDTPTTNQHAQELCSRLEKLSANS